MKTKNILKTFGLITVFSITSSFLTSCDGGDDSGTNDDSSSANNINLAPRTILLEGVKLNITGIEEQTIQFPNSGNSGYERRRVIGQYEFGRSRATLNTTNSIVESSGLTFTNSPQNYNDLYSYTYDDINRTTGNINLYGEDETSPSYKLILTFNTENSGTFRTSGYATTQEGADSNGNPFTNSLTELTGTFTYSPTYIDNDSVYGLLP